MGNSISSTQLEGFSSPLPNFEFMNRHTAVTLAFGYFRLNDFFGYNVKCDDFISIISKYIISTAQSTIKLKFKQNDPINLRGELVLSVI